MICLYVCFYLLIEKRKINRINCRGYCLTSVLSARLGLVLEGLQGWISALSIGLLLVFLMETISPCFRPFLPYLGEHFSVSISRTFWEVCLSSLKNRILWLCHIYQENVEEVCLELKVAFAFVNPLFLMEKEGFLCIFRRWDSQGSRHQFWSHKVSWVQFKVIDNTYFGCR